MKPRKAWAILDRGKLSRMTASELRALRASWGLRQIDMARLLRVTAETMNRYESGAYPFPQSRADYLRSLDGNPRLRAVLMKERGCLSQPVKGE